MKTVSVDNYIDGVDYTKLPYNHELRNFDFLIGKTVRGNNMIRLGEIVDISYYIDEYGHHVAMAILSDGRRINCRTFGLK